MSSCITSQTVGTDAEIFSQISGIPGAWTSEPDASKADSDCMVSSSERQSPQPERWSLISTCRLPSSCESMKQDSSSLQLSQEITILSRYLTRRASAFEVRLK